MASQTKKVCKEFKDAKKNLCWSKVQWVEEFKIASGRWWETFLLF